MLFVLPTFALSTRFRLETAACNFIAADRPILSSALSHFSVLQNKLESDHKAVSIIKCLLLCEPMVRLI